MVREVGSYYAKTKLPELLRLVEAGESFTITNRGRAIADIVPSQTGNRLRAKSAVENILGAKKHLVPDAALAQLRQTGRK